MRRLILVLLVVAIGTPARADRKKAEKLFTIAEKAYRKQDFLVAAENFERAYKEFPAPEIAFSAAQAFRRQYRVDTSHPEYVDKAIHYYEIYLGAKKTGGRVGDAADSLEDMVRERSRLGGKKTAIATVEKSTRLGVSVVFADEETASTKMREVDESKASGEEIKVTLTIDGKPYEVDRMHPVEPGEHVIRAEADGYEPAEKKVKVIPDAEVPEELTLQPKPAEVTLTTEEGATVIVDGRGIGEAPVSPIKLAAGSHVITVIRTGRRSAGREVNVTRAQKLAVAIALEPTLRRKAVPWVLVVSGIAVGVAGSAALSAWYFDSRAQDHHDALERGNADASVVDDFNTARIRRNRALTGMYVMSGTAVAIAITAAWLYYFDSPSAEGVTVVPHATESSAGAAVLGRF